MKKSIRLLIENLFDDLYDINQEDNLTIEIADKMYQYKLGDVFYYKKEPYAICCGESSYFNDNKPRFIANDKPYYNEFTYDLELKNKIQKNLSKINFHEYNYFKIGNKSDIQNIDENGIENTKNLFKLFPIHTFPLLKYIKAYYSRAGYIPAITELEVLLYNKDKLPDFINKDFNWFFYSSTFYSVTTLASIYSYDVHDKLYVCAENPYNKGYLSTFINIDKIKK